MLFCEIHPICYEISLKKEICKRHIKDYLSDIKFAKTKSDKWLPNVVTGYSCDKIDGLLIRPGEMFSFWHTVGKTTKKKGYKDGRVIIHNKLIPGLGGGLCNLGNTIHYMVLHSPLQVTEFHHHSDALAPEEGKRVPFSTGTSISYNYIDYRFINNTDQMIQLHVWCDDEKLHAELRSETEFPWRYALVEEDHHFQKEDFQRDD